MSTPPARRRRASHRTNLAGRAWPHQPRREEAKARADAAGFYLDEQDATIDAEGDLRLSLRGLLRTMAATPPKTIPDPARRARCIRLREITVGLEATQEQIGPADLGEAMIARLGGEALRRAHGAGDEPFLAFLDRELAHHLV